MCRISRERRVEAKLRDWTGEAQNRQGSARRWTSRLMEVGDDAVVSALLFYHVRRISDASWGAPWMLQNRMRRERVDVWRRGTRSLQ